MDARGGGRRYCVYIHIYLGSLLRFRILTGFPMLELDCFFLISNIFDNSLAWNISLASQIEGEILLLIRVKRLSHLVEWMQ